MNRARARQPLPLADTRDRGTRPGARATSRHGRADASRAARLRRRHSRKAPGRDRPDQPLQDRCAAGPLQRRRAARSELRPRATTPARPRRQPQTQPCTAHDPRHTETLTPRDDRLHRTAPARRQNQTRGKPLPQTLPRPQPLPPPRTRNATDGLNKHRSITRAGENPG